MVGHSRAYKLKLAADLRDSDGSRTPATSAASGDGEQEGQPGATARVCFRLANSFVSPKQWTSTTHPRRLFRSIDQTLYHTEPNLAIFLCMYLRTSHKIKTRMLITALGCSSCTQCVAGAELVNLLQVGVLVRRHPWKAVRMAGPSPCCRAPCVTCAHVDWPGRPIEEEDATEKGIRGLTARPTYLPKLMSRLSFPACVHVSPPARGPVCRAQFSDGRKQGIMNGLTISGRGTTPRAFISSSNCDSVCRLRCIRELALIFFCASKAVLWCLPIFSQRVAVIDVASLRPCAGWRGDLFCSQRFSVHIILVGGGPVDRVGSC